jgi:hypothetical protein
MTPSDSDGEHDSATGPTCDHSTHDGAVAAVAQYEGMRPPAGPTYRFWACPEHVIEGCPPLRRVDPGQENRAVPDQEGS